MRKLIDVFRAAIVSFEFCVLLASIIFYKTLSAALDNVINSLTLSGDYWKGLIALPGALTIYNFRASKQILFPPDKQAEALGHWPEYYLLKNRVLIGVIYTALSFIVLALGSLSLKLSPGEKAIVLLSSFIIIAIVSWNFYLAEITIREIFREVNRNSNTAPKTE